MLIDLHALTRVTEPGGHDPSKIIERVREAGLDGVAFVDPLRSSHAKDLLRAGEEAGFPVFVGVEIPAQLGRFLCFAPEVDPFLYREEWRQLMAVTTPPTAQRIVELFDEIEGAVIAAQPYARENGVRLGDNLVFCDGLHGVEALTAEHKGTEINLAVEAAVKMGLPMVGGSAAVHHLRDVGRFATLFSTPVRTQAELVAALRGGDYWAVNMASPEQRSSRRRSQPPRRAKSDSAKGDRPSSGRQRRRRPRRDSSSGGRAK